MRPIRGGGEKRLDLLLDLSDSGPRVALLVANVPHGLKVHTRSADDLGMDHVTARLMMDALVASSTAPPLSSADVLALAAAVSDQRRAELLSSAAARAARAA
jgi:hypothetical protein